MTKTHAHSVELRYIGEFQDCSICDERAVWACEVCGKFGTVYLCNKKTCWDEHEKRYSHQAVKCRSCFVEATAHGAIRQLSITQS